MYQGASQNGKRGRRPASIWGVVCERCVFFDIASLAKTPPVVSVPKWGRASMGDNCVRLGLQSSGGAFGLWAAPDVSLLTRSNNGERHDAAATFCRFLHPIV
uniref:Uncharacterized protein n=1 Tax=Eutreptiella gymnastica TaxID=73025 RepID=A0A7S1NR14_9EUGL